MSLSAQLEEAKKRQTSAVTFAKVKALAKKHGLTFFRGKGYYYWWDKDHHQGSAYVFRVDRYTMKQWEKQFKEFVKEQAYLNAPLEY